MGRPWKTALLCICQTACTAAAAMKTKNSYTIQAGAWFGLGMGLGMGLGLGLGWGLGLGLAAGVPPRSR